MASKNYKAIKLVFDPKIFNYVCRYKKVDMEKYNNSNYFTDNMCIRSIPSRKEKKTSSSR